MAGFPMIYNVFAPPGDSGQSPLDPDDGDGNVIKIRAARDYTYDDLAGSTSKSKVIYQPSHPRIVQISKPILMDIGFTKYKGDGLGLSKLNGYNGQLTWGMMRKPLKPGTIIVQDLSLLSNRAYDLNGILDASIAGNNTAGVNFGYFLNSDSFLAFPQGPISLGPQPGGWPGLRQWTFDFFFHFPVALTQQVGCGILAEDGQPAPLRIVIDPGRLLFIFFTPDLVQHSISVPCTANGPVRISVQGDMDAGTTQVYTAKVQVTPTIAGGSFAGATLLSQRYAHFQIGEEGGFFGGLPDPIAGFPGVVVGYRFTAGLLYKNLGVGQAQTRIDNAALVDSNQFFGEGGNTKFVLSLLTATTKSEAVVERIVPTRPNNQYGFWCQTGHGYPGNIVHSNSVEDMTFSGGGNNYGTAGLMLATLYFHAKNCEFNGQSGASGFVQPRAVTNYTSVFENCRFNGGISDAALGLSYGIAVARNCVFNAFGRWAVRTLTTDLSFEGKNLFGSGPCEAYFLLLSLGDPVSINLSGLALDIEGGIYPSVAAILAEASPGGPSNILISNPVAGTLGPGVPFAKLVRRRGDSTTLTNGRSSLRLVVPYWVREVGQAIIDIDKTGWDAQVETNNPGFAPQITVSQDGPGLASVIPIPAPTGGGSGTIIRLLRLGRGRS